MALHVTTSTVTLPKRVTNVVGPPKEWLGTGKAYEILLGHDIGYDEVDEFQGIPAHYPGPPLIHSMSGVMDYSSEESGSEVEAPESTVEDNSD